MAVAAVQGSGCQVAVVCLPLGDSFAASSKLPAGPNRDNCSHAQHDSVHTLCSRVLPAARLVLCGPPHAAGTAAAGPRIGSSPYCGRGSRGRLCRGAVAVACLASPTNAWAASLLGPRVWIKLPRRIRQAANQRPAQRVNLHCHCPLQPGTLDLVLLKRKGFVRVALEGGASLVPVLAFGENEQVSSMGGAMPCVAPSPTVKHGP